MAYLLDSNVFIQASRQHYGMDFCPAFWDWLLQAHDDEIVLSVERVGGELEAGDDELAEWARERGDAFFLPPDPAVLPALAELSNWAQDQEYSQAAINTFLDDTDYYLVAHALAHGHIVVTHEIPSNSRNKIKIPDACIGVGVKFVRTYDLLRKEGVRFVLAAGR